MIRLLRQTLKHRELGRYLGTANDGHQRPRRFPQRPRQGFQFRHQERPRTGLGRLLNDAASRGMGAMRRAESVHHENVAQRRQASAQGFVVGGFAMLETNVLQQRHRACAMSAPFCQSLTSGTLQPSFPPSTRATGANENFPSRSPASGRPRCDTKSTAAPAFKQCRIVGKAASMRVPSATSPPFNGTLKSSRTSTRLPPNAISAKRATACVKLNGSGELESVNEGLLKLVADERAYADFATFLDAVIVRCDSSIQGSANLSPP